MLLSHFKKKFFDELISDYPETEISSFFYLLTEEYLQLSRLDLALKPEYTLGEKELENFEDALSRLKKNEPIQYIIGYNEFYGLKFHVDPGVLIPRPETEELVSWILEDKGIDSELDVLDIGTGSGCIAISLAANLKHSRISAIDFSPAALAVANKNAQLNKANVDFIRQDILNTSRLPKKYDVIVSNPPYVRDLEKKEMQPNVLIHEPGSALYVRDEDPLIFYRKIAQLAMESLPSGGALYFEINQYLAEETRHLLESLGFESVLKRDIFGNFRMLRGIKK